MFRQAVFCTTSCFKHFAAISKPKNAAFNRGLSSQPFFSLPLKFKESSFNSATLEIEASASDAPATSFRDKLLECIASLKQQGKTAAYFKVCMARADLIPIAGSLGFQFHHAEGTSATMLLWLREDACKVPVFATHHCGVGGLVLHEDKILVVKEHGINTKWKLPGGLADLGENIEDAVEREVLEETGVTAKFESILTMRHAHKVQFGRSDLYFTCLLKSESNQISIDAEIQDAMWMEPERLKEVCPFPTVLMAVEMLQSNKLDKAFTGRSFQPYYAGRQGYQLYSTKDLELWIPNYISGLTPP